MYITLQFGYILHNTGKGVGCMFKEKLNMNIIIVICISVIALISLISFIWAVTDRTAVDLVSMSGETVDFSDDWENENGMKVRLNEFSVTGKFLSVDKPLVFTKTITSENAGNVVFMHTRNLAANIYLGDEELHVTSRSGSVKKLNSFDNYITVRIHQDSVGKKLKLELYRTEYPFENRIDNVRAGSGSAIMKDVFSVCLVALICGALGLVVGIGFVIVGIFTRKRIELYLVCIYFGAYLTFLSLCMIFDTAWMHIAIDNTVLVEKAVRIFLIAALPSFAAFVDEFCEMEHYIVSKTLVFAAAAAVPIMFLLDTAGLLYYTAETVVIHVLIAVSGVVIIAELILYMTRAHKIIDRKKRLRYISVILLIVCNFFDLLVYYGWSGIYDNFIFTRWGVLIITASVVTTCFVEILQMIKLGVQAGRIGKIAFTDANTGIGNVAAFKAKFDDLDATRSNYKYIGIIQFDVNNLKVINDTKGHEAGDLLIKTAAGIIDRSFRNIGTCYRTGGDEFVAIIVGEHAPIACDEAIYKFNKEIDKFNENPDKPFELRIAHGVAYYQNDVTENKTLKDIHKLADERMYSNKKMLKARYAHSPEEAAVR